MMKKILAMLLAAVMLLGLLAGCGEKKEETKPNEDSALNVAVFYYDYSDVYISSVRNAMDAQFAALGITPNNYDGAGNQASQTDQINTAIANGANLLIVNIVETSSPDAAQNAVEAAKTAGIPIIFFNREVADEVVNSYEKCAFVGTDAPEAGHMQGKMIGEYLLANYDAVDLNGDGVISYVMFKGQEGNAEAEARTQFGVEDANAVLTAAGKPELAYYNASATDKYLVDQGGKWSAQAANDYMAFPSIPRPTATWSSSSSATTTAWQRAQSPLCRAPATTPATAARPSPSSALTPPTPLSSSSTKAR